MARGSVVAWCVVVLMASGCALEGAEVGAAEEPVAREEGLAVEESSTGPEEASPPVYCDEGGACLPIFDEGRAGDEARASDDKGNCAFDGANVCGGMCTILPWVACVEHFVRNWNTGLIQRKCGCPPPKMPPMRRVISSPEG